ncbi:MAG: L-histidine N(alpha)-methyltransferase [Myxococcota bacterium]
MTWHVLTPTTAKNLRAEFSLDVLTGLSERPKRLSSRWFYDDEGSRLFRKIMGLEEYYPTDMETWIFTHHGPAIAKHFAGRPLDVVDLGAGDGAKALILLQHLQQAGVQARYVPIDISEGAMASLYTRMQSEMPGLALQGVVGEYVAGLRWLSEQDERERLVLFLGSNIGNFDKPRARAFLRRIWTGLREGDHTLIGFDLKKDIEVLLAAYNDREGVTRDFNLNLLTRINRELGGNFNRENWRHFGSYNVFNGAMESYLVSLVEQTVYIEDLRTEFHFQAWEPIHTEYSYKYLPEDIESLAQVTGFQICGRYSDPKGWFCDALWHVRRSAR